MEVPERTPDFGMIPGISSTFPPEWSLAMFKKTCINHYFELEAAKAFNMKLMKMPVYLSVGAEHLSAAIAALDMGFMIFGQHRGHSYYLSFGGDRTRLIDELLHRETGCAGGMGGSASIHDPSIPMFGHSGLMGDQLPIAVGAALGSGRNTLAVVGDASAEEDYVGGALGYAETKKVPLLVVVEDNDLSILTHVATRRSWKMADLAKAYGMRAADITDDPWLIAHYVREFGDDLPALLNIRLCRHLWHAGTGTDGPPEWNRFSMIKDEMARLGLASETGEIEEDAKNTVRKEWEERLPKQSSK